MVAPVVLFELDGREDSLSYRLRGRTRAWWRARRSETLLAAFFDALIGHQDRHSENSITRFRRLGLFDHEFAFPTDDDRPDHWATFVEWRFRKGLAALTQAEQQMLRRLLASPDYARVGTPVSIVLVRVVARRIVHARGPEARRESHLDPERVLRAAAAARTHEPHTIVAGRIELDAVQRAVHAPGRTDRERNAIRHQAEALRLAAAGRTPAQIAEELGLPTANAAIQLVSRAHEAAKARLSVSSPARPRLRFKVVDGPPDSRRRRRPQLVMIDDTTARPAATASLEEVRTGDRPYLVAFGIASSPEFREQRRADRLLEAMRTALATLGATGAFDAVVLPADERTLAVTRSIYRAALAAGFPTPR